MQAEKPLVDLWGNQQPQNRLQRNFAGLKIGYKLLKELVSRAGLERATLCLEVGFLSNTYFLTSQTHGSLIFIASVLKFIEADRGMRLPTAAKSTISGGLPTRSMSRGVRLSLAASLVFEGFQSRQINLCP